MTHRHGDTWESLMGMKLHAVLILQRQIIKRKMDISGCGGYSKDMCSFFEDELTLGLLA